MFLEKVIFRVLLELGGHKSSSRPTSDLIESTSDRKCVNLRIHERLNSTKHTYLISKANKFGLCYYIAFTFIMCRSEVITAAQRLHVHT